MIISIPLRTRHNCTKVKIQNALFRYSKWMHRVRILCYCSTPLTLLIFCVMLVSLYDLMFSYMLSTQRECRQPWPYVLNISVSDTRYYQFLCFHFNIFRFLFTTPLLITNSAVHKSYTTTAHAFRISPYLFNHYLRCCVCGYRVISVERSTQKYQNIFWVFHISSRIGK
jgi:hypothetical protein